MDRKCGIVILCLGIFILWQGRHLAVGNLRDLGPGFFPTILAVLLIILSLFLLIPKSTKQGTEQSFPTKSKGRVLSVFLLMVAYYLFLEHLGFLAASFLLLTFLFHGIGSYRWHVAILQALISVGSGYVLFAVLLKTQLPRGILGF